MNAVAQARKAQVEDIRAQLDSMLGQFAIVLPPTVTPERFVRNVLTAIQNEPSLIECDRRSLYSSCMSLANDGYVPDRVRAALVPFKDKSGNKIVTPIKMIFGLREKVRESGEVSDWRCEVVYANDVFDFVLGDEPHIIHKPVLSDRGAVVAAYSVVTFRDGTKSRDVMSRDDIDKRRAVARTQNVWDSWFDEMAKKTIAKRHAKSLPQSPTIDTFFRDDDTDVPERPAFQPKPPAPAITSRNAEGGSTASAPASDAAADQGFDDIDTSHAPGASLGEETATGTRDDAESFAVAITSHAKALTAAAKDGPLALSSAWARVPAAFKDALRDTYANLAGESPP